MSAVRQFLKDRKKAELQTIHQFWYPGEPRVSHRDELERRLTKALTHGLNLEDRLSRLSNLQKVCLTDILEDPDYQVSAQELLARMMSGGNASLEVESAVRTLMERGFLARVRAGSGNSADVFEIPEELGQHLQEAFSDVAHAGSAHQLTQKRFNFEIDFEGDDLESRIDALEDSTLRKLARIATSHHGVADRSTPGVAELLSSDAEHLRDPAWRDALEESGIGTIGSVSLGDFGILAEDPAVIILQEWIQRRAQSLLTKSVEPDTVLEAGVDLYIDLERLAERLSEQAAKLTRNGKVPKRLNDALRAILHLPRLEAQLEGDLVASVIQIGLGLNILEPYGDEIRVNQEHLAHWRKLELARQADIILDRFRLESRGGRWSFHQEALRDILLELLRTQVPEGWVSFEALVASVVSTYLLELEEREVKEALRQRREEDFAKERLHSTFHRLGRDLTYWVVNRLTPLGLCELGHREGRLTSFRLTPLGLETLGIQWKRSKSRILVNPDFEIILFYENLEGMQLEQNLARFGQRVSAERVRRYRVDRDSMRRGIRSGLSLAEIRSLLQGASEHPLPDPVLVALKDWGQDLDWIRAQPGLLLRGLKPARARELSRYLEESGLEHQLCPDGSIIVPPGEEGAGDFHSCIDLLREGGWLVRDELGESDAVPLDEFSL